MRRSTHAQKLERWIGAECVQQMSDSHRLYRGEPIPVANVPGYVYVTEGGDFCGPIKGGAFASFADFAYERSKRILRNTARRTMDRARRERFTGISSLSDLISEYTAGKGQDFGFFKNGALAASGGYASLWGVGSQPAAGATPSVRPGGSVPTNATVGSLQQADPGGTDTLHLLTVQSQGNAGPNTLVMYDRTFHASSIQHNTTSAQSITGTPTRYATTTSPGVFAFLEVTTALGATAQNLTMTYTDQDGNAAEAAAALAMVTSAVSTRIPHTPYFIPYNPGDTGIRTITNLAFSVANTAGVSNIVMGRRYCLIPQSVANSMVVMDGINSAFNFKQVLSGACVAFLEIKGVSSATQYTGTIDMCAG